MKRLPRCFVRLARAVRSARDLAYRLFNLCEKKKRAQEAQAYNALVLGWPEITRIAREGIGSRTRQTEMFGQE